MQYRDAPNRANNSILVTPFWRSAGIGVRWLDVTVEHWWPQGEPERVEVWKQGRRTAVTVYRDFNGLLAPGDPVRVAALEADAAFEEIRTAPWVPAGAS